MKIRSTSFQLLPLIFLLINVACQHGADDTRLPLPAEAFTSGSSAATFIAETTLKDGSYDNILDGASCSTILLPVTVTVNGHEIIVSTADNLKYVERAIDDAGSDDHTVNFKFPITVTLPDYTTVVVTSESQFKNLVKDCVEGGGDDDIECLDFVYPVKISVYNSNTQISDVITITDDDELYSFVHHLTSDDFASFQFPVTFHLLDGTPVIVSDNEKLAQAIDQYKNACDEDDDDDFKDDDVDDSNLKAVLIIGDWIVDYYYDESDRTSEFAGFTFTFKADGNAMAVHNATTVDGDWDTYGDDGELELDLEFDKYSNAFDDIGSGWKVTAFTSNTITLHDNKNGKEGRTLTFKKP